jgi:hypothetical protein
VVEKAVLAKEVTFPQNRQNGLFAALGCDREFYVPALDIEHRIGSISLRKYFLFVSVLPSCLLISDPAKDIPSIVG